MSRKGWVLFAALSVIWGTPYLMIKVAVAEVAPVVVVATRTGLAALVLVPVAAARGALRPALDRWPTLLVFAVLEMAGPWLLLADAERRLTSATTGLLIATVPLTSALLAFVLGDRSVARPSRLVGLVVGFAGVAFVVGAGTVEAGGLVPVLEVLAVVAGYTFAPFIAAHRLRGVPDLGIVTASVAAVALAYLMPAVASAPDQAPSAGALWSLAGLAALCTGAAFLLYLALMREVGPARAAVITYVNPAVAVALGVVLLDEPLAPGLVAGLPLVIAGCVLATWHRPVEPPPILAETAAERDDGEPDGLRRTDREGAGRA